LKEQEEAGNDAYLLRSTCVHADGVDGANAPRSRGVSENFTADKEKAAIGGANVSNIIDRAAGNIFVKEKRTRISS